MDAKEPNPSNLEGSPVGEGDGYASSGRRRHVVVERRVYAPVSRDVPERQRLGDRLRQAVNLKVPVVLLGLAALGLVLLFAAVYLIGLHKGKGMGRQSTLASLRESSVIVVTKQPEPAATEPEAKAEQRPEAKPEPTAEKRRPGLNYLVVATYPRKEADRLVEFLRARGLEAQAIGVHNSVLYRVVALRGFDAQGLRSKEFQQYKQQILLIGREWNTRNKGPTNLSDVWPQRYDG